MKLEALFDAVVVKPIEHEENNYGSIVIPDLGKEKNETAIVVSVGPGRYTITGELIPSCLKPGDVVVLPSMGATRFQFEGEEYYVIPENQVMARIV